MLLPARKASVGSTYNSGEDVATTPVSSEVDERQSIGMLASPLQVQPQQEFITLTEKVLCHARHTFRPVQGNLWRCTRTKESRAEIQKSLQ